MRWWLHFLGIKKTKVKEKSIVSDILKGLRPDGHNNYDRWHYKIKYLLSENNSIYFITEEVKPLFGKSDVELKRHFDNASKDHSA